MYLLQHGDSPWCRFAGCRLYLAWPTLRNKAPDLNVDLELADNAFAELRDLSTWLIDSEPQHLWFASLLIQLIQTDEVWAHSRVGASELNPGFATTVNTASPA
jgi:hypothetical protein